VNYLLTFRIILTPERIRLDASRFLGYHTQQAGGLMQHGYNPNKPKFNAGNETCKKETQKSATV
jgi:hypothetical protein